MYSLKGKPDEFLTNGYLMLLRGITLFFAHGDLPCRSWAMIRPRGYQTLYWALPDLGHENRVHDRSTINVRMTMHQVFLYNKNFQGQVRVWIISGEWSLKIPDLHTAEKLAVSVCAVIRLANLVNLVIPSHWLFFSNLKVVARRVSS